MDVNASMDAPCTADRLFALVDELNDYPLWMPLTHSVEEAPTRDVDASRADGRAWNVELRARIGPFARSKRLRMVRSVHDRRRRSVRFERAELDARTHSSWVLDAQVVPVASGSRLDMRLHYGGALWTGGVMERVLADQIVAGRERLADLAGRSADPVAPDPVAPDPVAPD